MRTQLRYLTLLALAALTAAGAGAADDYEIKLARPYKVGDKYSMSSAGADKQTIKQTVPGKPTPLKIHENKARLVALVEVLEVNAAGKPAKLNLTVEKCTRTTAGVEATVIAPGQVLEVTLRKDQNLFVPKEGSLSPLAQEALRMAWPTPVDDDAVYGVRERKKVGDTWPLTNPNAVMFDLKRHGIQVKPEDLTGTVTLAAARDVGGVACLEIGVALDAKNPNMPVQGALTNNDVWVKETTSVVLPVDASRGPLSESQKITFHFVFEGKSAGGTEKSDVTNEFSNETMYTY